MKSSKLWGRLMRALETNVSIALLLSGATTAGLFVLVTKLGDADPRSAAIVCVLTGIMMSAMIINEQENRDE